MLMLAMRARCDRVADGVAAALLVLSVSLAAASGCYNPTIADGGLVCADAGKACPDGFECNPIDHRCHKPSGQCSAPAVTPLCQDQPATGAACNPTCQTGCACGRCNVAGSSAVCSPTVGTKTLAQTCSPTQDDCGPGLICLLESCGTGLGRCYRHCTTAGQCTGGAACVIPILDGMSRDTGFKTCDLAPQDCDPIARTGCPNAALTCFVDDAGQTICDCPGRAVPVADGGACTVFSDCAPGLACVATAGIVGPRCRQICLQARPNCSNNLRCVPIGARYGYCGV
jgi:hypothetical protein